MKYSGVLKARNLVELKAINRGTIFLVVTRFYDQIARVFELLKLWYDF